MERQTFIKSLNSWRNRFPSAKFHVRSYEKSNGDVLSDFCSVIGLSNVDLQAIPKDRLNVSLTDRDALFLLNLKHMPNGTEIKVPILAALRKLSRIKNAHPLSGNKYSLLNEDICRRARTVWNQQQKELHGSFGFPEDYLLLHRSPDSSIEWRDQLNDADMRAMVAYLRPALSEKDFHAVASAIEVDALSVSTSLNTTSAIGKEPRSSNLLSLIERPLVRSTHPPLFVFSLHKSGSTMLNSLMAEALESASEPSINMPEQFFKLGVLDNDWRNDPSLANLIESGFVYTGFRYLPEFMSRDMLAAGRSVLLVRDPRDALVSAFFSFGANGSHVLPGTAKGDAADAILKARAAAADMTINEWVLKRARAVAVEFMRYAPHVGQPDFRLFRYEDVLFDKARLLADVFAHFGLPLPANAAAIAERHHVLPGKEDPSKHIRKATPGDHRDKLTPETIAELDRILAEPLRFYGYTS